LQLKLIDLGLGNLVSIECWLKRLPREYEVISHDDDIHSDIDAIYILPGVSDSVKYVELLNSWERLTSEIKNLHFHKLIAVCAGYQALCEKVTENGREIEGLGVIPAYSTDEKLSVPNNGWASVNFDDFDCHIEHTSEMRAEVYFNHSCGVFPNIESIKNFDINPQGFSHHYLSKKIVGLQYHPEKSGKIGGDIGRSILDV
jgi:glutamine amidotransferase